MLERMAQFCQGKSELLKTKWRVWILEKISRAKSPNTLPPTRFHILDAFPDAGQGVLRSANRSIHFAIRLRVNPVRRTMGERSSCA